MDECISWNEEVRYLQVNDLKFTEQYIFSSLYEEEYAFYLVIWVMEFV